MLGRELSPSVEAHSACAERISATPLEQLRLLESLWPQIERTLYAITACPDSRVQTATVSIPLARSRGGPEHPLTRALEVPMYQL